MDISFANTEALLRFHRFHERLNRSIKVQAIGLGLLADEIDAGTGAEEIKRRLYARPGWLWGGMPDWNKPDEELEAALRDIGQGGVARAYSAFDLFLDEIRAELTSWLDFSRNSAIHAPALDATALSDTDADKNADPDRVVRFYEGLGAKSARISHLWCVYRYFRIARNCIAHREGVASQALVEAQSVPELVSTLEHWVQRTGEMLKPELVSVIEGAQIAFTHRQAIAASSTLRLIACDLAKVVIHQLGERGFVYLAARRAFFDTVPLPEAIAMTSMVKTFNEVMTNRYRVRSYNENEALSILRELGLTKKCSARFAAIKKRVAPLV